MKIWWWLNSSVQRMKCTAWGKKKKKNHVVHSVWGSWGSVQSSESADEDKNNLNAACSESASLRFLPVALKSQQGQAVGGLHGCLHMFGSRSIICVLFSHKHSPQQPHRLFCGHWSTRGLGPNQSFSSSSSILFTFLPHYQLISMSTQTAQEPTSSVMSAAQCADCKTARQCYREPHAALPGGECEALPAGERALS